MAVSYQIVEQFEKLCLVKVAHDYHIVMYDQEANQVKACYSGDRIKGQFLSAEGFSDATIRAITKGRKFTTARAYYRGLRAGYHKPEIEIGKFAGLK